MAVRNNKIVIVGCGPGGRDYLTGMALREIEAAEVLVGAPRLLEAFPGSRAKRVPVRADLDRALARIAACRHRRVVVLVTGDPGLCSFAQPVIRRYGRAACRVIPGVSSVQAAFAAIGEDWTDARMVAAHGRAPDPAALKALAESGKIAVLVGHPAARPWLERLAAQRGRRIYICQDLTLPEESVRRVSPRELNKAGYSARSVILFIRQEKKK